MWTSQLLIACLLLRQSPHVEAACSGDLLIDETVFDEGENLSFENCGVWTSDGDPTRPPWRVAIVEKDKFCYGVAKCYGHLISPTTVISIQCFIFYDVRPEEAHKIVKDVKVFLGVCADDAYAAQFSPETPFSGNCKVHGKGQITQALEVNYLTLRKIRVAVIKMDKVDVKLNQIWPVCLFNKNNHHDFQAMDGEFFTSNRQWLRNLTYPSKLVSIKTENCNVNPPEDLTDDDKECREFNNYVCARYKSDFDDEYVTLWYKDSKRFYLRGLTIYHGHYDYEDTKVSHRVFLDLLAVMHEVASYTNDIYIMPKIPASKPKPDFSGTDLNSAECGLVASRQKREATPFITRGSAAQKYQHPWHAALITETDGIVCGGTLISKTAVLTAAHCVYNRDKFLRRASEIEAFIGVLNAEDLYDTSSGPAQAKKVIGWGLTEKFEPSDTLLRANLRVESYRDCYLKLRPFFSKYLKPGLNFCAGSNGVGACNGDSGGGFSVKSNGRVWLRGLVSFGNTNKVINNGDTVKMCNLNIPSLYVDLASYMHWLINAVKQTS